MFTPNTDRIKKLAEKYSKRISDLEVMFDRPTKLYIDFANVRPWSEQLGWHIDLPRVKQFFDSFDMVKDISVYNGLLCGDLVSEHENKTFAKYYGSSYITKNVKVTKKSINMSSVSKHSPDILKSFVRASLLNELKIKTVDYLNEELLVMNQRGVFYLEDRKCNFDVEIGGDIYLDLERNSYDCFVLWSGDSDFAHPVSKLLDNGKRVFLFATTGRISYELNDLRQKGLEIYDIRKIRDFICWKKEMLIKV